MKTLKIPTFALLFAMALLVFSMFSGQAKAEMFISGGAITTNSTIEKCSGACDLKLSDSKTDPLAGFGYYFKTNIVDIGAEAAVGGDHKLFLVNVRKRFGKWAVEAGAGRHRQKFDVSFGMVPYEGLTQSVSGKKASGNIFSIGATRQAGKKGTLYAKYLHSNTNLSLTRSIYAEYDGERYLKDRTNSRVKIDSDTVWIGYRRTF